MSLRDIGHEALLRPFIQFVQLTPEICLIRPFQPDQLALQALHCQTDLLGTICTANVLAAMRPREGIVALAHEPHHASKVVN